MPSPRVLKLADQIKGVVASTLERRVKDPRLGFVTVTDVRLTGDSRDATIYYTVLGSDADHASTAAALASAKGMLRTEVGQQLKLRYAPSLTFVPDVVPETARSIEDALERARAADADVARAAVGKTYAGEADPYKKDEPAEEVDPDDADPEADRA